MLVQPFQRSTWITITGPAGRRRVAFIEAGDDPDRRLMQMVRQMFGRGQHALEAVA